ncbi:MAG: HAD family hydrolase [Tannerella sp.]|jgi:phosphoglycolate phosphatase|nr:HAD family hydrolase [Tannerella sp.]
MIKLVVFDLDGTIGETIPTCIQAFQETVFSYSGKILPEKEIILTFGLNEEGMMRKVMDKGWETALEDFYTRYQEMHAACPEPFDGIKDLIAELKKRHILVALVTGKGARSCQITLRQFGMEHCFDSIDTGSPDKNIKAESLENLRDKYNLSPDELVYIGDTVSDIISCHQAGIRCLSAGWSRVADLKQLQERNKEHVFPTVQSLAAYIFREK